MADDDDAKKKKEEQETWIKGLFKKSLTEYEAETAEKRRTDSENKSSKSGSIFDSLFGG